MVKKNEVVNQSTGEIMSASTMARMQGDAGKTQSFRREDLTVPRINILQDLSPQIKPRDAAYVDGATAGMIFNSVTSTVANAIIFIPSKYDVNYVAWRPRPHGGLVDSNVGEDFLEGCEKVGVAEWRGMMTPSGSDIAVAVEIIETPSWAGIVVDADGLSMPAVISFPKTASKASRVINSRVEMTEFPTADGSGQFTPASFYHRFVMSTAIESSGDNEWFGWSVKHDGLMTEDADMHLVDKASKLYDMLTSGEVKVADEQAA